MGAVDHVVTLPPDLTELQAESDEDSPPNFYIARRSMRMLPSDLEEFTVPIGQSEEDIDSGKVLTLYSCVRGQYAREHNGDFARIVWFDHYPPELLKLGEVK